MIIKQSGGTVYGAKLSRKEERAMNMEIQRSFAEYDRKNANEIDAIFLCYLHNKYGFGYDRLKQAYLGLAPEIERLCQAYEMTDEGDRIWLATHKLKELGIDLDEWKKEIDIPEPRK